ncbi:DUF6708 domain-containing protein [Amantichitinum ursilacus]|uniref:DUF6708 domain-containing protein n=1 Tax=Amantichitinum ursilacus TaxID=857265 RepID=A0A0N0GQ65_9NEIS|nr:DUF6708 domain-containing protein [Amantichitinum ursilacus]KPC54143.1 hypothetical protein WG78_05820 [Amantichitinum ursilacus]
MHSESVSPIRMGTEISPFEKNHGLPKNKDRAKAEGLDAVVKGEQLKINKQDRTTAKTRIEATLLNDSLYGVNSNYLEIIDQSHPQRSMLAMGAVITVVMVCFAVWSCTYTVPAFLEVLSGRQGETFFWWQEVAPYIATPLLLGLTVFSVLAMRFAVPIAYFRYTRYPIRLNRQTRTLYKFRSNKPGGVWAVPWDADNVMFCISYPRRLWSRRAGAAPDNLMVRSFDIRCYVLDDQGKVERGFCIGEGFHSIAQAQENWAYYLRFMEDGPRTLRLPHFYWNPKERYSLSEMFAACRSGHHGSPGWRVLLEIIDIPMALLGLPFLALSLWTSREPRWPQEVEQACQVAADDPYARPLPDQPVGLAHGVERHKRDWGWVSSARQYAPDKLAQWLPLYQPVEDAAQKRYPTDA